MLALDCDWLSELRRLLSSISASFLAHPAFVLREDSAHCTAHTATVAAAPASKAVPSPPLSAEWSLEALVLSAASSLQAHVEAAVRAQSALHARGEWTDARERLRGAVEERSVRRAALHVALFTSWHCCPQFLQRALFPASLTRPSSSSSSSSSVEAGGVDGLLYAALSSAAPHSAPSQSASSLPCYLYFALVAACSLEADMRRLWERLSATHRRECEGVAAVYSDVLRAFAAAAADDATETADAVASRGALSPQPSLAFTFIISLSSTLSSHAAFSAASVGETGWAERPFLLSLLSVSSVQPRWVTALAGAYRVQHGRDFGDDGESPADSSPLCAAATPLFPEDVVQHDLALDLCLSLLSMRRSVSPALRLAPLPPSVRRFCRAWLEWHDLALSACRVLGLQRDARLVRLRAECFAQRVDDEDVFGYGSLAAALEHSGATQPHQQSQEQQRHRHLPRQHQHCPHPHPDDQQQPRLSASSGASLSVAFLSGCVPCPLRCSGHVRPAVTSAFNRVSGGFEDEEAWADLVEASVRAPTVVLAAVVQAATSFDRAAEMASALQRMHPPDGRAADADQHLCALRLSSGSPPLLCEALSSVLLHPASASSTGASTALFASCVVADFNDAHAQLLEAFVRAVLPAAGEGAPASCGPCTCPWACVEWVARLGASPIALPPLLSTVLLPALSQQHALGSARCSAALVCLLHVLSLHRRAPLPSSSPATAALSPGCFPAVFHLPFVRLCSVLSALLQRRSRLSLAQQDLVAALVECAVQLLCDASAFLLACAAPSSAVAPSSPLFAAALRAHAELTALHCTLTRLHWSSQLLFYPLLNHGLHALVVLHTPTIVLSINVDVPLPAALLAHLNRLLGAAAEPPLSAPWVALTSSTDAAVEAPAHWSDALGPLRFVHDLLVTASASAPLSALSVDALAALFEPELSPPAVVEWARAALPATVLRRSAEVALCRIARDAATAEADRLMTAVAARLVQLPPLPAPHRPAAAALAHLQLLLRVGELLQRMRREERAKMRGGGEGRSVEWTAPRYGRAMAHLIRALTWLSARPMDDARDAVRLLALTASAARALSNRPQAAQPASIDHPMHLCSLDLLHRLLQLGGAHAQPQAQAQGHTHSSLARALSASALPGAGLLERSLCSACWLVDVHSLPAPYARSMLRKWTQQPGDAGAGVPAPPRPS